MRDKEDHTKNMLKGRRKEHEDKDANNGNCTEPRKVERVVVVSERPTPA